MTTRRRIAATAAVALTALGVSATAASAGEHERIVTNGGIVLFDHTGDWLGAIDKRTDGLSVRADLVWFDRRGREHEERITDDRGNDEDPNAPGPVHRQLSIPESTAVILYMCYVDDGVGKQCSKGQSAVS